MQSPAELESPEEAPTAELLEAIDRSRIRVLVVDDELTLRESCASVLKHEGYSVTVCGRGDEAAQIVRTRSFDILLLDLYMSQVPGMELLRLCMESNPETLVIVMTGKPTVSSNIEALRAGAWDYLPKPFSASHLQILIGRAAHTISVARETRDRRAELESAHGNSDKLTLLGTAPAFTRAIEVGRKVAVTDASVFITGESGTGKDLLAQFIHHHSRRSSRPLVSLNCAALPEPLLESEMFGHTKGAFTGAVRDKPGLLEVANGGTVFLDEVTEMSPAMQAKLLRVIQDGYVRRVGSNSVDAVVNVRFITATNRDPKEATSSGVLREDLYFRLRVVPIHLPPLRERRDDIPILARYFLVHYWNRHRSGSGPVPELTDDSMAMLKARRWPGNVRELQNAIEHAVVFLDPGSRVRPEDLQFTEDGVADGNGIGDVELFLEDLAGTHYHDARDQVLARFERSYLSSIVSRAEGNMSKAARMAGVDRTTLYRLMDKHGLQRETIIRQA